MSIRIDHAGGLLAAGLLVLASSCALEEDDIAEASQATLVPVTWVSTFGVSAVGNNLTKTGANGWNAGAVSAQTISGDGAVEFTTGESTMAKAVGLSNGDATRSYKDIDFAFYLTGGGAVRIYEAGVEKASVGTYVAGDVFRIRVISNFVIYSQNGALLYISDVAPTFPLLVDTSLNHTGATIQNVVLGDPLWQNAVGVGINGDDLVKTGPNGWNGGASSLKSITSDGAVTFTTLDNTTGKAAGLSNGDSNQSYTDIDYCIQLTAGGAVRIYEQGVLRATVGTYVAGDLFSVESVAGVVRYRKNGVYLYTSSVAPTFPLLADTALNQNGATLQDVRLSETFWQFPAGVSISGYTLTKTGAAGWNAGASTFPAIFRGGGYVEFTATESTTAKAGGLSHGDSKLSYTDIDFAFYLTASGGARIYEGGVLKASVGTYQPGFTFRVEVAGDVVTYRKNGVRVYTSALTPTFPLLFDSSLNHPGGQIANVGVVRNPGAECDPVIQDGCVLGEKCAWLELSAGAGETACVPNGTVTSGSCFSGPPGPTTGYDNCAAGMACVDGLCKPICSLDPDSCGDEGVCFHDPDLFTDDPAANAGVCSANCDPIAQDCADPLSGCYIALDIEEAICIPFEEGAENGTQNQPCVTTENACAVNGCAPGYAGLLWNGDNQPRLCTAYCSPVNTYVVDPDGDGSGPLVEGADPDGAAPADCSLERTGVAGLTCRFVQSYFADGSGNLDGIPPEHGFCVPVDDVQGDCTRYSLERLFAIFDAAVANGDDGYQAVSDFCAANPLDCATGCLDLAERQTITDAYCVTHPGSSACAP